jgi:hypothetical protein
MPYQEFQENLKIFSKLIESLPTYHDDQISLLAKRYIEQNVLILNDILATSIANLNRLNNAKSANDIICIQARFTNEIGKNLTLSAQRFLNASLGHIADYNEWLKAHCDLATD